MIPLHGFTSSGEVVFENFAGHLARDAGRTHDEALVIAFQIFAVGARTHVITIYPGSRNQFDEVFISLIVFSQDDKMVAAHVAVLLHLIGFSVASHIHFASDDGFKLGQALFFAFAVHLFTIVVKLFCAEHVAMVCEGHASHTVGHGLVYETLHARLSVEN